jgi:uncharacterized integral membrane protein
MKGQTYVILSIIFTIIISVFAVLNIEPVVVNYLFWRGSSPLIFVILFSVLLGGILTTMVGSKKYFVLKRENKQLHEKVAIMEAEHINKDEETVLLTENNQEKGE